MRSEMIKYGDYEQSLIFQQMDEDQQKAVWVDRLTKEAKLYKGEKKSILLKMADKLSKGNYDPSQDEKVVKKLFGMVEAKRILTTLRLPNESNIATKFINKYGSTKVDAVFFCGSCSTESDWCSGYQESCQAVSCQTYYRGCGTLWLYWCNGNCNWSPEDPGMW